MTEATRASTTAEVAASLVGIHSSDASSVYLAARARLDSPDITAIEGAIYESRDVVRILGMRRTMFVVPIDLLPMLHHGCAAPLVPARRRRLIGILEDESITNDGQKWLTTVERQITGALAARGPAAANELKEDVPSLGEQISFGAGKKWGGKVGVSTQVLFLMANEGRIVRGRPRGSWLSSQYRWALMDEWLPGGVPAMEESVARDALVERWLLAFGPGLAADLKWWTGWTVAAVAASLDRLGAVEVEVEGGAAFVHPDDVDPVEVVEPWTALLPSLDSTVMGWSHRDWYLGSHRRALFDRNGNAGPTVWWHGRVVGGWAQRSGGEVAYRLLEDVGSEAASAIEQEAGILESWLGDSRTTPRFRTPLERELSET